jgi:hypothetical protein
MVTISDLHEWIDKHAPDCTERRVLHLALERLLNFEAGLVPELKGKLVTSLDRQSREEPNP